MKEERNKTLQQKMTDKYNRFQVVTVKQKCIPVGCVTSAAVAISGGVCLGVSVQGGVHLPPVDRQTPVFKCDKK